MKADEIIIRQDRVVYALMILFASLGLFWGFWQHKQKAAIPGTSSQTRHAFTQTPAANAVYVQ